MENTHFHILTGGPGSGKTTVLQELGHMGYHVVQEVARGIIQRQIATNGTALPWADTSRYVRLMFLRSVADFEEFCHLRTPCFFDRGIIDTLGYCQLIHQPFPSGAENAACRYRYNQRVFLFPFWEEIYVTDNERKQDMEEAKRTAYTLQTTYEKYGYQILSVPFLPPRERAEWLLAHL